MEYSALFEQRDPLTGLVRTKDAMKRLTGWVDRAKKAGRNPSIFAMLLGMKRFTAVNLAYGEHVGDRALAEVAQRILMFAHDEVSRPWVVARVAGGSFLLAVEADCTKERWQWLAEEVAQSVAIPIVDGKSTVRLVPRVAMLHAETGEDPARMLSRLMETLDDAHAQSGARLQWVDGNVSPAGLPSHQLEADLLAALDRDEIEIVFQPQFSTTNNAMIGAEALARWKHPVLGQMSAGALFTIAERADHVGPLSRHIAAKATAAARAWPDHLRLSLNVTATDLAAGNFAESLLETLDQSGFPAERLTLEITEQVLLAELGSSAARLQYLCNHGVRIALDDFGAGFCNFRYLKRLPLHYLKLDHSMVDGVNDDAKDLAVLRAILAMAKALDLNVIAEGVETEAQLETVTAEGCDAWQGYFGARPMSAADFLDAAKA